MAGFGPEDDHFVVELTYNYGIKQYQLGNDFQVITHLKKKLWFPERNTGCGVFFHLLIQAVRLRIIRGLY